MKVMGILSLPCFYHASSLFCQMWTWLTQVSCLEFYVLTSSALPTPPTARFWRLQRLRMYHSPAQPPRKSLLYVLSPNGGSELMAGWLCSGLDAGYSLLTPPELYGPCHLPQTAVSCVTCRWEQECQQQLARDRTLWGRTDSVRRFCAEGEGCFTSSYAQLVSRYQHPCDVEFLDM